MIGQVLANYQIERFLGAGGMGMVYQAVHRHLARRVALKILRPQFSADRDALSRFFTEARAANLAQHPSVLEVYEFGFTNEGCAYIVMEYIEGCSLQKRLDDVGRLGTCSLALVRQVAVALASVHAHGVVHRDLKPENMMLLPDSGGTNVEQIKILDFGIAKCLRPQPSDLPISKHPTQTGAILGTPSYLSPEQARGDRELIGPPADVYALGVMFYELLSGRLPFEGGRALEQIFLHVFAEPQPLRRFAPRTPRPVAELVHRMLRKSPLTRPTMVEVASELELLCKRYRDADIPRAGEARARPSLRPNEESTPFSDPFLHRLLALANPTAGLFAAIRRTGHVLAMAVVLVLPAMPPKVSPGESRLGGLSSPGSESTQPPLNGGVALSTSLPPVPAAAPPVPPNAANQAASLPSNRAILAGLEVAGNSKHHSKPRTPLPKPPQQGPIQIRPLSVHNDPPQSGAKNTDVPVLID